MIDEVILGHKCSSIHQLLCNSRFFCQELGVAGAAYGQGLLPDLRSCEPHFCFLFDPSPHWNNLSCSWST